MLAAVAAEAPPAVNNNPMKMIPLTDCTFESNTLICFVETAIHMRRATINQRNAIPAKGMT